MNPKEILFIYSKLAELTAGEERAEYQRRIAQLKGVANP